MTTKYYNVLPGEHTPNVDAGIVLGVLSMQWLDIKVIGEENYNNLKWRLASESNLSYYEVERSLDGINNFEAIGLVSPQQGTISQLAYTYQDADVIAEGVYYYRVKQVDTDGAFDYSEIVSVSRGAVDITSSLNIYPNPVVDVLTLDLYLQEQINELKINAYDNEGRLVKKDALIASQVAAGSHVYRINIDGLPVGIYFVEIMLDDKRISKKFFVVE